MAKKKTTKSSRSTASSAASKKKSSKKKTAKKTVTKKKVAKKAATKKVTKKKAAKKAATKKKVVKKPTAKTTKKKVAKKVVKKVAKKSPTKKPTKKATTKKKVAAKPAVKPRPVVPKAKTEEELLQEEMDKEWTIPQLKRVKTGLKKKDLDEFLQLLLEKRTEIIGNVQGMETARNAALADISHMPLHMADVGSDNFEQEFTLGLMESEREMLREIEEAIVRMREGYYGVCVDSGRVISRMRLEFAPWAKYCITVARLREKRGW